MISLLEFYKMFKKDSPSQLAVYDAIKNTTSNITIKATAGSGKTTTMLRSLKYVPSHKKSVFLSFSKAIVTELKSKVPFHVKAATLHSLGFGMMMKYFSNMSFVVNENKYFIDAVKLLKDSKEVALEKKDFRAAGLMSEVCNYARMTLTANEPEALSSMCIHYNIDFDKEIIANAQKLLSNALKVRKIIDYTDMIYFPAMMPEIVNVSYDFIFLDEAQDTNNAQLTLIESIINKRTGRLISVGDEFQCIYGFSGASMDAFEKIRNRPNTISLPLTVSYRCPKSVVAKAQTVCPSIEAWEEANEGAERKGSWEEIVETDIVLSRTTKPLIGLYFKLLEKDVRARIVGKDIEKGLVDLAEMCMAKTKEKVIERLQGRYEILREELQSLGIKLYKEHASWRALEEKEQVITLILGKIESTSELVNCIKGIFDESKDAAKLMTIHRSKGLENDRVFLIEKHDGKVLQPSSWAIQQWEHIQERNLFFVAFTRAKEELVYIDVNES